MSWEFTQEYFEQEFLIFFSMCSDKEFWQKPEEERNKAFEALGYIYLNLDNEADKKQCADWLHTASINYQFRNSYIRSK